MVLIVVLYALLASTFVLAKKSLTFASPCFLIGFRMTLAGIFLLGYHRVCTKKLKLPEPQDRWLFFKMTLFHIYLAFILEFWALRYITALKTTIIYAITPFVAAFLSYLLLGERLTTFKTIGILVGCAGLIPVLLAGATSQEAFMVLGSMSLPEIVLLISVVSSCYAWFLVKELMKKGYNLGFINGVAMFFGGIMSLFTSFAIEPMGDMVIVWGPFLGWVLALIVVANLMVYNLYGYLLQHYSITLMTVAGFLTPTFATVFEWLFMDGVITWHYAASLVLVTLGLFIFCWHDLKKRSIMHYDR